MAFASEADLLRGCEFTSVVAIIDMTKRVDIQHKLTGGYVNEFWREANSASPFLSTLANSHPVYTLSHMDVFCRCKLQLVVIPFTSTDQRLKSFQI